MYDSSKNKQLLSLLLGSQSRRRRKDPILDPYRPISLAILLFLFLCSIRPALTYSSERLMRRKGISESIRKLRTKDGRRKQFSLFLPFGWSGSLGQICNSLSTLTAICSCHLRRHLPRWKGKSKIVPTYVLFGPLIATNLTSQKWGRSRRQEGRKEGHTLIEPYWDSVSLAGQVRGRGDRPACPSVGGKVKANIPVSEGHYMSKIPVY